MCDADRLLILDTDLLSTVVYSEHYYGTCPRWVTEAADRGVADLYLLAAIDVPWVADGEQRDRGDRREEIQGLFRQALTSGGRRFVETYGPHTARMRQAVTQIDDLLRVDPLA